MLARQSKLINVLLLITVVMGLFLAACDGSVVIDVNPDGGDGGGDALLNNQLLFIILIIMIFFVALIAVLR